MKAAVFKHEPFTDALVFKYLHSDSTRLEFEHPEGESFLKAIVAGFGLRLERVVNVLRHDHEGLKTIISDAMVDDEARFCSKHINRIQATISGMGDDNPQKSMLTSLVPNLQMMHNYLHPEDSFIEENFGKYEPSNRDKASLKLVSKSIAFDMSSAFLTSLARLRGEVADRAPSR
jgi:hypothetical protein